MFRSSNVLLASSLIAIAAAQPVLAQDATANEQLSSSEIVVTAQRREETLRDVPISITALSGDTLAEAGIQDTERLSNLTPGLLVQRSVVGKISIRGVGNENYTISGDPGVAVHSDGIYVARAAAGLFDLFDISRVEVLRGPQGTLYGRNATGGVINVIPNAPDDEYAGRVAAEYGNYGAIRLEGMVNAALYPRWIYQKHQCCCGGAGF
jgi:iron complex outermembrane recepter protein